MLTRLVGCIGLAVNRGGAGVGAGALGLGWAAERAEVEKDSGFVAAVPLAAAHPLGAL